MGGSPGNFGILTHVRLQPLHDKDYPDSRMMKFETDYTPEKHRAVTAVLAEMTGDQELPKNYNYGVTVISPGQQMIQGITFFSLNEAEYHHGRYSIYYFFNFCHVNWFRNPSYYFVFSTLQGRS